MESMSCLCTDESIPFTTYELTHEVTHQVSKHDHEIFLSDMNETPLICDHKLHNIRLQLGLGTFE